MPLQLSHTAHGDIALTALRRGAACECITPDGRHIVTILADRWPRLTLRRADGRILDALVWRTAAGYHITCRGETSVWQTIRTQHTADAGHLHASTGRIVAPLPGRIIALFVQPGATVTAGQPVMVIEAMKMQNEITAPHDGQIAAVYVQEGQAVEGNAVLVEFS